MISPSTPLFSHWSIPLTAPPLLFWFPVLVFKVIIFVKTSLVHSMHSTGCTKYAKMGDKNFFWPRQLLNEVVMNFEEIKNSSFICKNVD